MARTAAKSMPAPNATPPAARAASAAKVAIATVGIGRSRRRMTQNDNSSVCFSATVRCGIVPATRVSLCPMVEPLLGHLAQ